MAQIKSDKCISDHDAAVLKAEVVDRVIPAQYDMSLGIDNTQRDRKRIESEHVMPPIMTR